MQKSFHELKMHLNRDRWPRASAWESILEQ